MSDFDTIAVTCYSLVDTVVDNFLGKVIGALGLCVHAGSHAHGLQTSQHLNGGGIVLSGHIASKVAWKESRVGANQRRLAPSGA
jgi:hypothetical protein